MLKIVIPAAEYYDEINNTFIEKKQQTLLLEHSLVSISKWEAKHCKPFLGDNERTIDESADYIRCMLLNPDEVDDSTFDNLPQSVFDCANKYIDAPMTATTFSKSEKGKRGAGGTITAEIIYYWMTALNIPFECQHWHLNRLLTLVRVCNIKNSPKKKMSKKDTMTRNKNLNEINRKKFNSKG